MYFFLLQYEFTFKCASLLLPCRVGLAYRPTIFFQFFENGCCDPLRCHRLKEIWDSTMLSVQPIATWRRRRSLLAGWKLSLAFCVQVLAYVPVLRSWNEDLPHINKTFINKRRSVPRDNCVGGSLSRAGAGVYTRCPLCKRQEQLGFSDGLGHMACRTD